MRDFTYYNPAKIIFGRKSLERLPDLIKAHDGPLLFHYGQNSIHKSGLYDNLISIFKKSGARWTELGGVRPNPDYQTVLKGIQLCKEHSVSWILAVGGGSVIDSAKAIAAGVFLKEGEDYWDGYFGREIAPERSLPVGVVLTIPASGSETSYECVITNEETKEKRSIGCESMIPEFAVVNPELHTTLPAYQMACGCADILSHLMERYFTQIPNVDLTDRLLEGCMRTIINYAPLALERPYDYDIRAEIAWTGTLAHNRLLDTGRRGDWATHEMQHAAGALFHIYHGEGLSVLFPAWMKYVWRQNPLRFLQFSTRVWGIDLSLEHEEAIILSGVRSLEKFFRTLGLPTRFSELSIGEDGIPKMLDNLFRGRTVIGRFQPLGREDAEAIYRLAL